MFPKLRVAVVSGNEDAASVHAAFAAGAVGFIPKTTPPAVMVAAVRLIAEGGSYFPPQIMAAPPDEARKIDLTGRQAAVLRLLLKGLGNQRIAKKLDISGKHRQAACARGLRRAEGLLQDPGDRCGRAAGHQVRRERKF